MTTNDKTLRDHLLHLLDADSAHLDFDAAVKDFPPEVRGQRPDGKGHSPWELLEHLRIAQWDILEFSRDAKHVSPEVPAPPDANAWDESVKVFRADRKAMAELVRNASTDLFAPIPHGTGQTIL